METTTILLNALTLPIFEIQYHDLCWAYPKLIVSDMAKAKLQSTKTNT